MMTLADKETTLQNTLKTYNRVVVGFSGGIDSTVVLKEALDVLGHDNVLAVVANSELFLDAEYEMAGQLAKDMGAQVTGIQLDYLANDQIKHNTPESWYAMKQMFYQAMTQVATQFNADAVLDGMIMLTSGPVCVHVTKPVPSPYFKQPTSINARFANWLKA